MLEKKNKTSGGIGTSDAAVEHPLFTPFRLAGAAMHSTSLFTGNGVAVEGYTNNTLTAREWLRARFLADAIPAESHAAGANAFEEGVVNWNVQMDRGDEKGCMSNPGMWPQMDNDDRLIWKYNDFKQLAYFFVYRLFDKFVGK